jgi:hypothetical protein
MVGSFECGVESLAKLSSTSHKSRDTLSHITNNFSGVHESMRLYFTVSAWVHIILK